MGKTLEAGGKRMKEKESAKRPSGDLGYFHTQMNNQDSSNKFFGNGLRALDFFIGGLT